MVPGSHAPCHGEPRPSSCQGVVVQDPTQLGGALMRKLVGLFAGAAILVAACGGTSTTPAPSAESSAPAARTPAESAAPSQSAAAGPVDLFGTTYKPADATNPGGTVIIGDWQEANQF